MAKKIANTAAAECQDPDIDLEPENTESTAAEAETPYFWIYTTGVFSCSQRDDRLLNSKSCRWKKYLEALSEHRPITEQLVLQTIQNVISPVIDGERAKIINIASFVDEKFNNAIKEVTKAVKILYKSWYSVAVSTAYGLKPASWLTDIASDCYFG